MQERQRWERSPIRLWLQYESKTFQLFQFENFPQRNEIWTGALRRLFVFAVCSSLKRLIRILDRVVFCFDFNQTSLTPSGFNQTLSREMRFFQKRWYGRSLFWHDPCCARLDVTGTARQRVWHLNFLSLLRTISLISRRRTFLPALWTRWASDQDCITSSFFCTSWCSDRLSPFSESGVWTNQPEGFYSRE